MLLGAGVAVTAIARARHRLASCGVVAASFFVMAAVCVAFGGSVTVIPAIVAGQAVVGGVAGTVLPRDRWNYLAVAEPGEIAVDAPVAPRRVLGGGARPAACRA
jgi:hypothetical protein